MTSVGVEMFSRTWALDGLEGLGLPLSKVQVCVPLGSGLLIPGTGLPAPGPGLVCLPSSLGPGLSPSRSRPKKFWIRYRSHFGYRHTLI